MDLLPKDLLADILRRLPPRPLAVCRSVSKDLRADVDDHGLLLAVAHRVPRSLRGVFVNYVGQDEPYFFSRRSAAAPPVDAALSFFPHDPIHGWREAVHQSNGLLLSQDWDTLCLCNPATRRWRQLPPRPEGFGGSAHIVFDPTVSLHYVVISFANAPRKPIDDHQVESLASIEWPPCWYVAQVFSSRTGRWERRAYVRENDVAVTLSDVWSDPWGPDSDTLGYKEIRCNAVSWRGAFYLHCHGGFVMREECLTRFETEQINLDDEKPCMHLGKSEHGIYYSALRWYQLQVWVLREASDSHPMPEWELKHKADMRPFFQQHYVRVDREEIETSWSLDRGEKGSDDQLDCGWDSSDDSVVYVEGEDSPDYGDIHCNMSYPVDLLGFHPSKEIALLGNKFEGFAYYLDSCKLQYLGHFSQ